MISTIINIKCQYSATYSQTVYVPKYSPRHEWFLRLLEVKVLHSFDLPSKPLRTLDIWGILKRGHRLIPESLAPEVQAI